MKRESHTKMWQVGILFLAIVLVHVLGIVALPAQQSQPETGRAYDHSMWFGVLELPFLFLAVFFGFRTANALKGGLFGRGMRLTAWGFLVMAIGHLHMQVEHFFHYNFFAELFGKQGGAVMWIIALVITWALTGLGFYKIYKASKIE